MNQQPIRRSSTTLITGLLAATLWLTGCAHNAKVSGQWLDGAPKNQTYKAVLLVGLTPDLNARCAFEHFLARHLQTAQTEAIASCDVMDRKQPLTRELVEAAVADQQIDAVLTTILVSKDWTMKEGGSRDTRGSAGYKATDSGWATGYYGWYGVPVVYGEFQSNATSMTMHGEIEVRSRLFETRGKTAVYEMLTKAKKVESTDVALATLTTAIADELRDAGLTR